MDFFSCTDLLFIIFHFYKTYNFDRLGQFLYEGRMMRKITHLLNQVILLYY